MAETDIAGDGLVLTAAMSVAVMATNRSGLVNQLPLSCSKTGLMVSSNSILPSPFPSRSLPELDTRRQGVRRSLLRSAQSQPSHRGGWFCPVLSYAPRSRASGTARRADQVLHRRADGRSF